MSSIITAENRRVVLKGEYPDYINATNVDVSHVHPYTCMYMFYGVFKYACHVHIYTYIIGIQAEESLYHCRGSNGVHYEELLEDDK